MRVVLVETIDKRSILRLETTINRQSSMRAFQNATHRLPMTTTSQDIEGLGEFGENR